MEKLKEIAKFVWKCVKKIAEIGAGVPRPTL